MTTQAACNFVMPFGKHKGKPLRDIATDDPDGARYLDWVMGLALDDLTRDALTTLLAIPWVAKLVDEQIECRPWWEK